MRIDYQPCDFTIFGVLGDLSRRKLIPSLYQLDKAGMLHEDTRIIGVARHDLEQDGFVDEVRESLSTFVEDPLESEVVERLLARLHYVLINLDVPGFLEEEGGNPKPTTETFVAIRVDIDNWRWAGVPFYLRTGKGMATKRSEVVINFKQLSHNIFADSYRNLPPNKLIIRLQPDEGVEIEMLNKVPGITRGVGLQRTMLDLSFSDAFEGERIADAYERLILQVMCGNQALFIHRDEVERSWTWIDSIQDAWGCCNEEQKLYPAGSWGPVASVALLARDGREWEE